MPDLTTNLVAQLNVAYSNAAAFGVARLDAADRAYTRHIPNGSASGQANKLFIGRGSIANGANLDLDLAGSLIDPLGQVVSFAAVMAIVVDTPDSNTGELVMGGATNGFATPFGAVAHTVRIGAGGTLMLQAGPGGWTVTPGTADILRLANSSGAAQEYELAIIGR